MTPKEKAIELVDSFKPYAHFWVHDLGIQKDYDIERFENAKNCALIAVDEILKIGSVIVDYNTYYYWQEVKQEIEKI